MTFDLVVTISMHIYTKVPYKKVFEVSDLRFIVGPSVRLSISSNLSLLNAYKWAFVLKGFYLSGILS